MEKKDKNVTVEQSMLSKTSVDIETDKNFVPLKLSTTIIIHKPLKVESLNHQHL